MKQNKARLIDNIKDELQNKARLIDNIKDELQNEDKR